jgi:hypothetical protein
MVDGQEIPSSLWESCCSWHFGIHRAFSFSSWTTGQQWIRTTTAPWHVRQKELSIAMLRHSKHVMTLLNRSPLLCNTKVNNVSAGAVTSCNREELLEMVFCMRSLLRLYNSDPASNCQLGDAHQTARVEAAEHRSWGAVARQCSVKTQQTEKT